MTKLTSRVIVSAVLLVLLLTGCKMPASKAPEEDTEEMKTTPIRLHTESPEPESPIESPETEEPGEADTQEPGPTPTNTPPPTEIVAVPTVTRPAEYTLKEGEYVFCIARRFDINPADLLALNNLAADTLLSTGTVLQIPQDSTWEGEGRVRLPHPASTTTRQPSVGRR